MNQIKPYSIWIGNAGDGRAFRNLFDAGIRAVVQLAIEEPPIELPREFIYQRFPLLDGEGNGPGMLRLAIEAITRLIEGKVPTLVCCGGGMSRSPVIAAAALAGACHLDLEQALEMIVANRPADVSSALLADIQAMLKNRK